MTSRDEVTRANRAAWNASAPAFEKTDGWAALTRAVARPGFSALDETLTNALQALDITGRRAVQVGCNNGRELLSLPALGAEPGLGIDISEVFLDQARRLAALAGSDCRFLRADIYDLPPDIERGFGLGLITIGVLNWMPDLPGFFTQVAGLLAEAAPLVIYETHPVLEMFDPDAPDPFTPTRSYFEGEPVTWSETITYDGSPGDAGPASFWFTHGLGQIVTAAVAAGLQVERLTEHGHSNREVEYDIYQGRRAQIPMCYTLVLRKAKC